MTALLDVNVLIALAWPNHVHHQAAHRWFREIPERSWATCPLTQSGFIRVSSNPATTPEARTPAEAASLLREMVTLPGHVFWLDDVSLVDSSSLEWPLLVGHRQVSDAHLLVLAARHRGVLATFDRGILDLVAAGVQSTDRVEVIGSR